MTETRRKAFEAYFLDSRKSKRKPNFARLPDGTYADDHTQRHWWTWQKALLYLEQAGAAVSDEQVKVALSAACLLDTRESRKDMRAALEAVLALSQSGGNDGIR